MDSGKLRQNHRSKLAIRALVSDRQQHNAVSCFVDNGSLCGCRINYKKVADLPDKVLITVPQLKQPIKGRIVWRNQNAAGVEFEWVTKHPDNKRETSRHSVDIPAVLLDGSLKKLADCIICDVSSTGCRIACETFSTLPGIIHIEIPGLSEPLLALIVWRNDNLAGLEFLCESDIYTLDNSMAVQGDRLL